ncbi:hypothetical protein [Alienimonas sp. DA493]|uniref:hypothetical protein n=1 Tax=Alienimonas sp. DA493 TaxID=3373605 RepID=UPI0037547E26
MFLQKAEVLPGGVRKLPHVTLARGESTGHCHRIRERGVAELFAAPGGDLYLRVTGETATLVHEEHGPIALGPGLYRSWIQREYSPEAIRRVID